MHLKKEIRTIQEPGKNQTREKVTFSVKVIRMEQKDYIRIFFESLPRHKNNFRTEDIEFFFVFQFENPSIPECIVCNCIHM